MMDTLGPGFINNREVVLSLEVKMYKYNREGTSKWVVFREVFTIVFFIRVSSEVLLQLCLLLKLCMAMIQV